MSRTQVKIIIDLCLWTVLTPLAFFLRLDFNISNVQSELWMFLMVGFVIKAIVQYYWGFHRHSWHRIGVYDLITLLKGIGLTAILLTFFNFFIKAPRSIPIIETLLAIVVLGGSRVVARLWYEYKQIDKSTYRRQHVLVIGAGEAAIRAVREMLRHPETGKKPVGFLDDDVKKKKDKFMGVSVLGKIADLPNVVDTYDVDEIMIAVPSQRAEITRKVVNMTKKMKIKHFILPGMNELLSGKVSIAQARDVDVEDLLGRKPIQLQKSEIQEYLKAETVLVTGAGGSIGSEIVRQVIKYDPQKLILVGRGENSIYQIEQELKRNAPHINFVTSICDVRNQEKLKHIFQTYAPTVVFHAAAHKHVPLMEENPEEAILNNIGGTRNLVNLSLKYNVKRFVNISTDKAVNPTSIMGASKRVSEYVVSWGAAQSKVHQSFVSVRFGNVLGSRGSVIPLFKEQIKTGGPITVTHADMTRYFMTIPEASQLVLQAGSLGENGSVYVLDMGEPIKIVDLAKDLILLSGLEVDKDIKIEVTGMRAGEKLYEELLTAEEGTLSSRHEQIFVAQKTAIDTKVLDKHLDELFSLVGTYESSLIKEKFKEMIPSFVYEKA